MCMYKSPSCRVEDLCKTYLLQDGLVHRQAAFKKIFGLVHNRCVYILDSSSSSVSTYSRCLSIQGCSTGLGKLLALEALGRGDKVIATARNNLERMNDLKAAGAHIMACDVTISSTEMQEIAKEAESIYGQVDVVMNNAGYATLGGLETVGYVSYTKPQTSFSLTR